MTEIPVNIQSGMDFNSGSFQKISCPYCKNYFKLHGVVIRANTEEEMMEKSKWVFGEFEILNPNLIYEYSETNKLIISPDNFADKNVKLHVGSGRQPNQDYLNFDCDKDCPNIDVWGDIRSMPFESGTIDSIIGIHVIEHIWWADLLWTFSEMNRVLKIGGKIGLEVPDLECAMKRLPEEIYKFNMALYAEFKTEEDYNYYANAPLYLMHHSSFDFEKLKWYLEQTGFGDITRHSKREDISQHKWLGVLAVNATKIGNPKPHTEIKSDYWVGVNKTYPYHKMYVESWG